MVNYFHALQEVIRIEQVPGNLSEYKMRGEFDPRNTIYNMAVNAESRTSGLNNYWQCIFLHNGHIPGKLDAGLSYESTEKKVFWENDKCSEPGQRRVLSYSVEFKLNNSGQNI